MNVAYVVAWLLIGMTEDGRTALAIPGIASESSCVSLGEYIKARDYRCIPYEQAR